MDLTIDRENQLGDGVPRGATPNTTRRSTRGRRSLYGGLNPFRSILLPSPTDSTLNAFALGIRGPGMPGQREPPRHRLLDPGVRRPHQRAGQHQRRRHPLDAAHPRDRQHPGRDQRRPEHPAADQLRRLRRHPGARGRRGRGGRRSGGLGGLGGFGGGAAPRQDIGTKVKIIPHLNDSDEVRLEVTEEISDIDGPAAASASLGVVPFAKRTAQTQLVVKDQQTVVIGGLMRSRVARTDTKIPLLGDIPVLGALFRSRSSALEKSNLILVLTPYIIREQADLRTRLRAQDAGAAGVPRSLLRLRRAERVRAAQGLLAHERPARGHPPVVHGRRRAAAPRGAHSARAR